MIARLFITLLAIIFASLQCFSQANKPDSEPSIIDKHTGKTALRFGLLSDGLLQTIGCKYWLSEQFAFSGHCLASYSYYTENNTAGIVLINKPLVGFYTQGEYHWQRNNSGLYHNISPYFAVGLGAGIAKTQSWYIVAGISIGVELFLASSLSLSLEQGLDISYEQQMVSYKTEPFISLLPFSKAGNNRLILHLYF